MKQFNIEKGKPLVLPDGTEIIKAGNGQTIIETPEDKEQAAQLDERLTDPFDDDLAIETFQRTLADITVEKQEFNPIMLVLSYSMWGLDQDAIARFLEIDVQQIINIQQSDLYSKTRKEMLEAIRYAEASSIHGLISQQARKAATVMLKRMGSKSEDISMAAAKDILDRAGFRPADKTEHIHRFEDDLRIVHLQQTTPTEIDVGI